jgi:hypothetical protein
MVAKLTPNAKRQFKTNALRQWPSFEFELRTTRIEMGPVMRQSVLRAHLLVRG